MTYTIDPTIPKQFHDAPEKPPIRGSWYRFFNRITRIIWFSIIIFLVVEGIFVATKLLSRRPDERMCWDDSMCFSYCYHTSQAVCIAPEAVDTENTRKAIKLLLTGKRNIIEVLNVGQTYCACEYIAGDEKKLDMFYNFYVENK